jgi:polar amino acid transport system substrate-binding protein
MRDQLLGAACRDRGRRAAWLVALAAILASSGIPRSARAFSQEQVDQGRETFRLQCARCHGPDGQGMRNAYRGLTAPPLIGPGSLPLNPHPYQKLRHYEFHTMLDVYEFASAVMPLDQPASLSPNDYWNVVAYILDKDGEKPDSKPIDQRTAAQASLDPIRQKEAAYAQARPMLGPNTAAAIMGVSRENPGVPNQSDVGAGQNQDQPRR